MSDRIESLDTLKGLAILAVVVIHLRGSFIGKEIEAISSDFIGLSLTRFAVPIFFLISGFLLKKKFEQHGRDYTWSYVKKLGYYYILASGLYLLLQSLLMLIEMNTGLSLPRDISMNTSLAAIVYNFLYTGYAVRMSLWFFPALMISISLVYIADELEKTNLLLICAALLHLTGILTNTYQLLDLPLPPRDAVFFGLFYTVTGFKIGGLKRDITAYGDKIAAAAVIFTILNIIERSFISPVTGVAPFFWQDYTFFTLPFAVSIFLLGLAKPKLGSNTRINTYGKYTLWGYIFHQIMGAILTGFLIGLDMLTGLQLIQNSAFNLVLVVLTYVLTMEAVIAYSQKSKS